MVFILVLASCICPVNEPSTEMQACLMWRYVLHRWQESREGGQEVKELTDLVLIPDSCISQVSLWTSPVNFSLQVNFLLWPPNYLLAKEQQTWYSCRCLNWFSEYVWWVLQQLARQNRQLLCSHWAFTTLKVFVETSPTHLLVLA